MKLFPSALPCLFTILSRAPVCAAFQPIAVTKTSSASTMGRTNVVKGRRVKIRLSSSTHPSVSSDAIMNVDIEGPVIPPIPATCKRLFMVRHGEVINPGGDRSVYYGAMDVSLSPLGEQEAMVRNIFLES
jgi:hypothetical protein